MYCIYRITNKINGKTYIGQHLYKDLNDNYMGSGKRLWEAYRKYGIENFKKEILVFNISKKEHIDLLEKTFIAAEREKVGVENCYNITDGGEGNLGLHHSEETKRKLSKANKGKHLSGETRKKISEAKRGKHHPTSEETKKKLSEARKGKHCSEETKRKISEAHKGKPKSEEWKRKMKGRIVSEETKKKISEALRGQTTWNKGKKMSEETKKKISEALKGKHWKLVDGKRVLY